MDIDLLSKMVKELILDSDRVVLPGLGSFVAEMVPSAFSDKGYTINPPYRKMFFRAKPDEGSELAELYARGNNVDVEVADKIIRGFIEELKPILQTRKTVVFPGLGRLRATRENNIFFVADEDLDIFPSGFGLEPVSLKTHQETKEEVAAAMVDLKSMLLKQEVAADGPEVILEPENISETIEESEALPDFEVVSDTEDEAGPEILLPDERPEAVNVPVRRKKNVCMLILLIVGIIIALTVLLLALLAVVGRTNPELIDRLLYTQEELKILNYIL